MTLSTPREGYYALKYKYMVAMMTFKKVEVTQYYKK